ncbi:transposase [Streptomyces sp. NPDC001156]
MNVQIVCRPVTAGSWLSGRRGRATATTSSSSEKPSHQRCPTIPDCQATAATAASTAFARHATDPTAASSKTAPPEGSAKRQAVAEHTIARLKDHQSLRQCRCRGDAVNHVVAGVAALHNLKLDIR